MKNTPHSIVPQSGPRTPETMFPVIVAKQSSGMSVKEFCAAHGLSEHIFYYWQRRHSDRRQDSGCFVEVEFNDAVNTRMRLNLGHGRSLELDGQVSPQWLGALIRELD